MGCPAIAGWVRTSQADPNPTTNFRPIASAHLCSVASVGFSNLPVSNRDRAGASIPNGTSIVLDVWFSTIVFQCNFRRAEMRARNGGISIAN